MSTYVSDNQCTWVVALVVAEIGPYEAEYRQKGTYLGASKPPEWRVLSKDRRWQIAERVRHGEADAIEQAIHDNRSENSKKYGY